MLTFEFLDGKIFTLGHNNTTTTTYLWFEEMFMLETFDFLINTSMQTVLDPKNSNLETLAWIVYTCGNYHKNTV